MSGEGTEQVHPGYYSNKQMFLDLTERSVTHSQYRKLSLLFLWSNSGDGAEHLWECYRKRVYRFLLLVWKYTSIPLQYNSPFGAEGKATYKREIDFIGYGLFG